MKILIWFVCIFIAVSIQVICKMNGILLGGIPTMLLFGGTWLAASRLCILWDHRVKRSLKKMESTPLHPVAPPVNYTDTTEEPTTTENVTPTSAPIQTSGHTKNPEQKRFCKYCGSVIDNHTKECTGCKKKYISAKIVLLRICLPVVIIAIISVAIYGTINYSNAVNAKNNQHFIEAREYYDNLLIPKTLFPNDYAYVTAGVLMERHAYIQALDAFEALESYEVPISIINSLKAEMYTQGQSYYQRLDYSVASNYFEAIGNYQQSCDYLLLLKCHKEYNESLTTQELNQLYSLIGFEDAANVILTDCNTAVSFLEGNWGDGDLYFQITKYLDGSYRANHNLPISDEKDTFRFRNGKYLTYPDGEISLETQIERNSNPHFSFKIIDRNTIYVYCFADQSTHVLYRK